MIIWDGLRIDGEGGGRVGRPTGGQGAARDARGPVGGSLAGASGWSVGDGEVRGSVAGGLVRLGGGSR